MCKLVFAKPGPMTMALIGAGILLFLSACDAELYVARDQDISSGRIEVSFGVDDEFDGRVDVHRINEDGSTGEVIGSSQVNSDTLSDENALSVELDLSRATDELAFRLYDNESGQNPYGTRRTVKGAGSTSAAAPTTDPATSTPIPPSPTPPAETDQPEPDLAYTGPVEYIDPHEDCHHFNRDPADCPLGIDMEGVLAGLARDETEFANFISDAHAKGYGINERPFTEPMAIFSIRINGFDPAAGNLCVIFASPQENFTPSLAGANVVQTCTFADGLTYTTRIGATGERSTEFDEAGPIGDSDSKTTITLFQPLGGIFREDTLRPFSIHMTNNEGNVLDDSPVENLLRYLAAPLESVP